MGEPGRDPWIPRVVRAGSQYPRRRFYHRWDVVSDAGWIAGFIRRRTAARHCGQLFRVLVIDPPFPDEITQEWLAWPEQHNSDTDQPYHQA